jgi:hypothetical protein
MRNKTVVLISVASACAFLLAAGLAWKLGQQVFDPLDWNNDFANMALPDMVQQAETPVAGETVRNLRGSVVEAKDYTLSGPFAHANLSVYLIHGPDQSRGQPFMTLQEALDQNQAVVHDTGFGVAIDNLAKAPLFIQAGDIVKGGNQDRVLPYDQIVPPEAKRIAVNVFCVEAGRSGPRGLEISTSFQTSTEQLPGKRLKLAATYHKSQTDVWEGIRQTQINLSQNVGVPVQAPQSQTSLQLTLENAQVQKAIGRYLQDLAALPAGKEDVIGFAVAVNGKIHGADIYANADLFKNLWPKLLRASAIEALAERQKEAPAAAPTVQAVQSFLAQAEQGKCYRQDMGGRMVLIRQETDQNLLFDTCDLGQNNLVLHRSYLAK